MSVEITTQRVTVTQGCLKMACPMMGKTMFEPTCAYARWAHMRHFLSVCDLTKIRIGPKVTCQKLKCWKEALTDLKSSPEWSAVYF